MTEPCILKLVATVQGVPTEFDGKYVAAYDPSWVNPRGYDGGILEVTDDPAAALRFAGAAEALAKWREPYGRREDGEPNRPLTAWSVEILAAP